MTQHSPPRVVAMPGNDVVSDPRVLKYMATLAGLGLEVVGVGVARKGDRRDFGIGGARVVVEVVPAPVTSSARARGGQLGVVFKPGYRTQAEHLAARAQVIRWARRTRQESGVRGLVLRAALLGPRAWTRVAALRLRVAGSGTEPTASELEARRDAEIARFREDPALSRWRDVLPVIQEDDRVLGALLDELEPDLVHVHDVFMLGVAAGAVRRARARGRDVRLVYDAHEYIPGLAYVPARTVGAYYDLEREFIGATDRIVTVSEPLADLLIADHGLTRRPAVVLNAPTIAEPPPGFRTLRQVVGLPDDVPLLVYGGGVNTARGVHTAVAALPDLPGVHLAVVTNRHNHVVEELVQQAQRLGVADRFHLAPYAAPEHVTHYFADVTIGLSTLLHAPNHDVAVTNKFCEYLLAGIPVVTSDTPAQADLVRELGLGAVYPAGSVPGLVAAVRDVLADRAAIAARISGDPELQNRFSWRAQAATIRAIYTELLGELPEDAWRDGALDVTSVSTEVPPS
jgi:glycosyltransferase involved in cell wall biosynthesis